MYVAVIPSMYTEFILEQQWPVFTLYPCMEKQQGTEVGQWKKTSCYISLFLGLSISPSPQQIYTTKARENLFSQVGSKALECQQWESSVAYKWSSNTSGTIH